MRNPPRVNRAIGVATFSRCPTQQLTAEAMALLLSERISLAQTLWQSVDAEELRDRVLIIDHGKLFFDGPLDTIVDRFASYKILSLTFDGPISETCAEQQAVGNVIGD